MDKDFNFDPDPDDKGAEPVSFRDVDLLSLLPGMAEAVDATKDPHARAYLLEAMRVAVDTARALAPASPTVWPS